MSGSGGGLNLRGGQSTYKKVLSYRKDGIVQNGVRDYHGINLFTCDAETHSCQRPTLLPIGRWQRVISFPQ